VFRYQLDQRKLFG